MTGVAISYGDVAVGAKENFNITVSEKKYDTISNLNINNMQVYDYANPCELYQTLLDSTAVSLPSDVSTANIGLWSEQLSDKNGNFATPIELVLESEGQYSSQGFTFTFDKYNDIYPTKMTIKWQRITEQEGTVDLSEDVEFYPTSGFYFCGNKIDNFNKITIKVYTLSRPKNRLKIEVIDYGYGTVFYGDELRNVKISQSIDPISSEIKIDTCDFTLDSKSDIVYSFQSKQALSVSFNDVLLSTCFVKTSSRTGKFMWDISAEDYISILDTTTYKGGMYTDKNAGELLEDIFNVAQVPYNIDDIFYEKTVSGHIAYTTCREALMQVCFAIMAVVDTSYSDKVNVKKLSDTVTQTIPLERIMQGQNFSYEDTVTDINITSHIYTKKEKIEDNLTSLYKSADSGTGENILVQFSNPCHDVSCNENGEIVEIGANYAIINAYDNNFELSGYEYENTQQIHTYKNPKVLAGEVENKKDITGATLINENNVEEVMNHCAEWLLKHETTSMEIIEGKTETRTLTRVKYGKVKYGQAKYGELSFSTEVTYDSPVYLGETITAQTEYLGDVTGLITSQSYSLSGYTIKKAVELK